jgi:uncharacterized protein (DUF1499 family)
VSSPGDTTVSGKRARYIHLLILGGALFGCSGSRPRDIGLQAGILRPCPSTPNCVSSEAGTATEKQVAPFPAPRGLADFERLAAVVAAWPRTEVITKSTGYLHAESTSQIMRFVDDLEFRLDSASSLIHVRSASRIGRKDFSVNRKRVDGLRAKYGGAP